ncbi:MAG: hypothetical protein KDD44_03395, partial [Bdellovibrionales bacterium]|nr:hypothetical protein [Bdellovibrionales bacterium]
MRSLIRDLFGARDVRELLLLASERIGQWLGASRVVLCVHDANGRPSRPPVEWTLTSPDPAQDDAVLRVVQQMLLHSRDTTIPVDFDVTAQSPELRPIESELRTLGLRSLLL